MTNLPHLGKERELTSQGDRVARPPPGVASAFRLSRALSARPVRQPPRAFLCLHFEDEEMEAQGCLASQPKSHTKEKAERNRGWRVRQGSPLLGTKNPNTAGRVEPR